VATVAPDPGVTVTESLANMLLDWLATLRFLLVNHLGHTAGDIPFGVPSHLLDLRLSLRCVEFDPGRLGLRHIDHHVRWAHLNGRGRELNDGRLHVDRG